MSPASSQSLAFPPLAAERKQTRQSSGSLGARRHSVPFHVCRASSSSMPTRAGRDPTAAFAGHATGLAPPQRPRTQKPTDLGLQCHLATLSALRKDAPWASGQLRGAAPGGGTAEHAVGPESSPAPKKKIITIPYLWLSNSLITLIQYNWASSNPARFHINLNLSQARDSGG